MKYGLIGKTLKHSFSKEIHEKIADYQYELCELPTIKDLDVFMNNRNFNAINVTIPYKEEVIPYLYYVDEKARLIGAVNTIINKDNKLYGYNTDYYGLKLLLNKNNIEINNKVVLILGNGGTAKTSYQVCKDLNAKKIYKTSRKKMIEPNVISYSDIDSISNDVEVIINTTPVGMYPNIEDSIIDINKFNNLESVCDVIYNPLRTRLLQDAEDKNLKTCDGLFMLVSQAIYASELFLNKKFDSNLFDRIYQEILNKKLNICLIGMPSSGKSTIGKLLSKRLNKEFVDTDDLIENKINKPIKDFLTSNNEDEFRKIEKEVIYEISKSNNLIISTGGGVIKNKININRLKTNSIVIFIDRDLSLLTPTNDRPLSSNIENLKRLYNERYHLYCDYSDIIVTNNQTLEDTVNLILQKLNDERIL